MQCGQRAALIGIDIVQAGQSLATAGASGAGRFILFIARTTRKMQNATIRKLMIRVTKFPLFQVIALSAAASAGGGEIGRAVRA